MMELTRKADYAIRGMVYLAKQEYGAVAMIGEIARAMAIPPAFLPKVFQVLASSGLVKSSKGAGGGVALARAPELITLREIVEAIEGPLLPNACLSGEEACVLQQTCSVPPVWRRLQSVARGILDEVSLKSLAAG